MKQFTAYIANDSSVKVFSSLFSKQLKHKVVNYLLNHDADKVVFERYPFGPSKLYNLEKIKASGGRTAKRLMFCEWLANYKVGI